MNGATITLTHSQWLAWACAEDRLHLLNRLSERAVAMYRAGACGPEHANIEVRSPKGTFATSFSHALLASYVRFGRHC